MRYRAGDSVNWRWIGLVVFVVGLSFMFAAIIVSCNRPPYNHVLTTVERVDEDADALRVYHDKVRGATCYETYGWPSQLSCIPDIWLTPKGAPLP